jgi:hypothetical protein
MRETDVRRTSQPLIINHQECFCFSLPGVDVLRVDAIFAQKRTGVIQYQKLISAGLI